MDPKGDRLRLIQSGQLKLPESVLKSNNIVLTGATPAPGTGGSLEGGPRPRHTLAEGAPVVGGGLMPIMVTGGAGLLPEMDDIPLPAHPDMSSIPLPVSNMNNIPLPEMKHENIPLPSNASIPLPPEKVTTTVSSERRKIRVSLEHLEPKGDELLCRSCAMKFSKQLDYDQHLQSYEHQQAIKADLLEGRGPTAVLLNQRTTDKKSPGQDNKSGHVSFSFKKNIGSRITNTAPFRREERRSSPEIKLLQPESAAIQPDDDDMGKMIVEGPMPEPKAEGMAAMVMVVEEMSRGDTEKGEEGMESKGEGERVAARVPVLNSFVKVQSKDDSGRVLDWPKEMIQYTITEPKLMFSCNPLSFDFSSLFACKAKKSNVEVKFDADLGTSEVGVGEDGVDDLAIEGEKSVGDNAEKQPEDKKKSHKKKKRRKHKKSKTEKSEAKDDATKEAGETKAATGEEMNTSGSSTGRKKRKKHKRDKKEDNGEGMDGKDTGKTNDGEEKDRKKHKKSKKKSKTLDEGDGDKAEEDGKEKKRKKKRKKSKKHKKRHHGESENEKSDGEGKDKVESESDKDSEGENKEGKKKKKKRKKHKRKETTDNGSSDSELEPVAEVKIEVLEPVTTVTAGVSVNASAEAQVKRKFAGADSDTENDKFVAKLQALSRTKTSQKQATGVTNAPPALVVPKKIKKELLEGQDKKTLLERKTPSDRKRMSSESSVNDATPVKKIKTMPKAYDIRENIPVATIAPVSNMVVKQEKEESWTKIETQTLDNVKSKWDTSDSDMDNALDDTVKKEKVLRKHAPGKGLKATLLKELKNPSTVMAAVRNEHISRKQAHPSSSSQRSNKSNVSAGSGKMSTMQTVMKKKSRRSSKSPLSSRSRSRSHHRSYSRSGSSSRSRSRSYSSSSYYSDDSRYSRSHHGRSSSRSYSRSSSRSRSHSYRRHRGRSSSYSDYSRSRSYSSSRSRSRSHRRRKRSYTRTRSRSYSTSSYSSRSRSRTRRRKARRKNRRRNKTHSRDRSLSASSVEASTVTKKTKPSTDKEKEVKKEASKQVNPLDIPLPDLSGKKDDEHSEEKLKKLKEKKGRKDVGETVAKLVESLPADIPLPFSEGDTKMVSSDALPHGSPKEAPKETDSNFIGPKMPIPPPPPPVGMGRGFGPNHGPPGPPRYGPGQWDPHWDHHSGWEGHGHWDGPNAPGPRPPYRGMRPPYDPRMYGPYDPRRRGPPPFMNRPRGPPPYGMGPRYPGPHGPHPDYPHHDYDYDAQYSSAPPAKEEESKESKSKSPPPLPKEPPKSASPKPPLPKKKETKKEPEQNPDIVIPPEQAEQYKSLQKQALKHARRQLRRQAKKELGEPDEDSTSSESEQEQETVTSEQQSVEELSVIDEPQPQLVAVPQQVVIAQPQPVASPTGAIVVVSGGQQFIVNRPLLQAHVPVQAGQPVIAVSQNPTMLASAAAAAQGAQPAHLVQHVPIQGLVSVSHASALPAGMALASAQQAHVAHLQQLHQAQQLQQLQQIQQAQQIQQIQQIQAHNQAVAQLQAAQHAGPIIVGNQILVPRVGMRPAL